MIKTFTHAGLKHYFETGNAKGIPSEMVKRIRIRLNVLDAAVTINDVALPGFDLHPLRGARAGEWAIKVSGNVEDLGLEDYH